MRDDLGIWNFSKMLYLMQIAIVHFTFQIHSVKSGQYNQMSILIVQFVKHPQE